MSETLVDPYCTLADVQRETKNDRSELSDWFISCINRASRFVEEYCNRDFLYHQYTADTPFVVPKERVIGDSIYLDWPIRSLTGVYQWESDLGKTHSPTATETLETSSYYIDNGSVRKSSGEPFGEYPLVETWFGVSGNFGYPIAEGEDISSVLPAHVRRATAIIAATFSAERRMEQMSFDGSRIELTDLRIPTEVWMMLKRYRRSSTFTF